MFRLCVQVRMFVVTLGVVHAVNSGASSYVLPDTRAMARDADAVVMGTVVSTEVLPDGVYGLVTVGKLMINERLQGNPDSPMIEIVIPGGALGDRTVVVSGAPHFTPGNEELLILARREDGRWEIVDLSLGRFHLASDTGQVLATRPGIDDRTRTLEELRAELGGARQVPTSAGRPARTVTEQGAALFPATDFVMRYSDSSLPQRRESPSISWLYRGAQPGLDGPGALRRGAAAWTDDPESPVQMLVAEGGNVACGSGSSIVIFNDLQKQLPGSYDPSRGGWIAVTYSDTRGQHDWNGATFQSITCSTIVVQDGSVNALGQTAFDQIMTHELGHALGFRHSDSTANLMDRGDSMVTPCTSNAIMYTATIPPYRGARLECWDRAAVRTVYAAPFACCDAPEIDYPPQSKYLPYGQDYGMVQMMAVGWGLRYEWFQGEPGRPSRPVAGNGPSVTVGPILSPTTFWAKVSAACGKSVVVGPATIYPCPEVVITRQPEDIVTTAGQKIELVVKCRDSCDGRWYEGLRGDTTHPFPNSPASSIYVVADVTKNYWAAAEFGCGAPVVQSRTATVQVRGTCAPPRIHQEPSSRAVERGESVDLVVYPGGSPPFSYQWFAGREGDESHPVAGATTNVLTTPPITEPLSYWLQVKNGCGVAKTSAVELRVPAARRRSVRSH